jgi:hypothetical protein
MFFVFVRFRAGKWLIFGRERLSTQPRCAFTDPWHPIRWMSVTVISVRIEQLRSGRFWHHAYPEAVDSVVRFAACSEFSSMVCTQRRRGRHIRKSSYHMPNTLLAISNEDIQNRFNPCFYR